MKTKNILIKKPWRRVRPMGYLGHGTFFDTGEMSMPEDRMNFRAITQADFLREYYPSGHAINDPNVYPDIYKEEEYDILDENGEATGRRGKRLYKELVPRYAFAFQQIILVKQCMHLCGNDIQCELNTQSRTEEQEHDYNLIREGWQDKDMEMAFFQSVKSVKKTGDTAFVGYMDNGTFGYKVFSFANGDTLYPHYDNNGKLVLFARSYFDYDLDGNAITKWLEIWDKTNYTRYRQSVGKGMSITEKVLDIFNLHGFERVGGKPHGFPFIPVAYFRDEDGACWSPSQESIDGYEIAFSQFAQNNQAFGFPIMYLQGENVGTQHDLNGTLKVLTLGTDDKAGFLNTPNGADSFLKQLDTLYRMIYEQSFAVIPPELKSGDLPAAALKILYSPAYEKAYIDSMEYQPFLNDMVRVFLYGYGLEKEKTISFMNLPIKWWIKPYVHTSESNMVQDLATAVQNGFISKQTASEKISFYSNTDEWERIIRESKNEQEADLLFQLRANGNATE